MDRTLQVGAYFPVGTVCGAYIASGFRGEPAGAPGFLADDTQTVDAAGLLAFTNLTADQGYYCGGIVGSSWVFVHFYTYTTGGVASSVTVSNFPAVTEVANDTGNPLPVSGSVSVSNFPASTEVANDSGNPIPVSASSLPLASGAATESTQAKRYGGGKLAKTTQVTASGDTVIHTPALGKAVTLYWVSAINDPDQSVSPRIRIGFQGNPDYMYSGYAVSHWETFTGASDQSVVVNLDQAADVAVTLHYSEA